MRQTLKGMGEARRVEESADTTLVCGKRAGVFCDALSVPGKAKRGGVGDVSSETTQELRHVGSWRSQSVVSK